MRKQIKIAHSETMFGHTYHTQVNDQLLILATNLESDWKKLQGRVNKDYFWFRAPKITVTQIAHSMKHLCDLSNKFDFRIRHDAQSNTWDASLKLSDEMDAANWAWSHTEMWTKWSAAQEKAHVQSLKPAKIKVSKSGRITVRTTVTTITDP